MEIPKSVGSYVIVGRLDKGTDIVHKRLGSYYLLPGFYCYCGSAFGPGGLRARVQRHMNTDTKKFWHFDYLKGYLDIIEVWWLAGGKNRECLTAHILEEEAGAIVPIPGFGASDCRNACKSHLLFFEDQESLLQARQHLEDHGLNYTWKVINQGEIG